MTTTPTALASTVDTRRAPRPIRPVRSLGTLTKRRLALTVRSPQSLVLPLVAPALFALAIAPALANTIHAGPGRTAYMTFVALSTAGLLIPLNCLFSLPLAEPSVFSGLVALSGCPAGLITQPTSDWQNFI